MIARIKVPVLRISGRPPGIPPGGENSRNFREFFKIKVVFFKCFLFFVFLIWISGILRRPRHRECVDPSSNYLATRQDLLSSPHSRLLSTAHSATHPPPESGGEVESSPAPEQHLGPGAQVVPRSWRLAPPVLRRSTSCERCQINYGRAAHNTSP